MTNRLWDYLENYFKATKIDSIEIITDQDHFIISPVYCDDDEIVDFAVFHGSYYTTALVSPNIWFLEEIEKNINF